MSIRVHKSIGWGLELEASQVDEERFMALASGDTCLSYSGFVDFVRELDYPLKGLSGDLINSQHDKYRGDEQFDKEWSKSFFQCVHGSYDPDAKEDDEVERFLIMTPYAATYNSSPSLPKPISEGDEAFVYAEFEVLFPDASPYTNQSYTFKSPPFPDSYEVIGRTEDVHSVRDFVFPPMKSGSVVDQAVAYPSLIRSILEGRLLQDDSELQKTLEDVFDVNAWQLSAPFINMALVEYSGILKNPQYVFNMKPRVLYYWT